MEKPTIYCDLDGVLVDFRQGYLDLIGIDIGNTFHKSDDFWAPIHKRGASFWSKLKWMEDGMELWSYISKYNPTILSAPSREKSSTIGKKAWMINHLPGTRIILCPASQKCLYANAGSLLIDDLPKNIEQWIEQRGIGILHSDSKTTIEQLKILGL